MRKRKFIEFTRNFSYTIISNLLSMIISLIIALIVPRLIEVEQYGYYQLYTLYTGYVGVSYLGLCDGIYLRIGGKYYKDLDKSLYSTQFRILGIFEIIVYFIIYFCSLIIVTDANKKYVIGCVCIAGVGMCLRWFITFILQATGRIKEYAIVTISERVVYVFVTVPLILAGYGDFKLLIVNDIAAKYISFLIGTWYCRDMIMAKVLPIKDVIPEIKENISAGFKFMIAQLCSMLIIGVVRFGIQIHWGIATFARVSVTLHVSNLIISAIDAIAIVLYPMMRRTNEDKYEYLYELIRFVLDCLAFGGMIFYYPTQKLLTIWLPQYSDSLQYAAILFPMCVYQSKMSLLINTYYKTLRLENLLMQCNMAALALSLFCTVLSTVILNSVMAAIFSILIVLIFRCVSCELLLAKHIEISYKKDMLIEIAMTITFIICNWFFGFAGMLAYLVFYVVYLFLKKNDLKETLTFIKSMK